MRDRKTITLNVSGLTEISAVAKEFYKDYHETSSHTVKRNLVDRVFRSGAIIEACGLSSIVSILDSKRFMQSSVADRQAMLIKALELSDVISCSPLSTSHDDEPDGYMTEPPPNAENKADTESKSEDDVSTSTEQAPKRTGTGAGKKFGGFKAS